MNGLNKKYYCLIDQGEMVKHLDAQDCLHKTSNKYYSLYRCSMCDLQQILPKPTVNEIRDFYPKNYYSHHVKKAKQKSFFLKLRDKIVDISYNKKSRKDFYYLLAILFKPLLPGLPLHHIGNKLFLDIGCGDGYSLDLMKKYGWETIGFEFGQQSKKGNIYYADSLTEISFDNKFDYIRLWHVLEHVANPDEYLKKIYSLLADDGVLVIGVPNTASFNAIIFGKYWYNLDTPRHLFNYNNKNLTMLLTKNNFTVERVAYNQFTGLLGSLLRTFTEKFNLPSNTFGRIVIILAFLFYPIDFIFNKIHMGDLLFLEVKKG